MTEKSTGKIRYRFVPVSKHAMEDERLDIYEFAVYSALTLYFNEHDKAFPSVETICKLARCGKTKVYEAFKRLEDMGYITREKRWRKDGTQTSSEYTVEPVPVIDSATRKQAPPHGVGQAPPHGYDKDPTTKVIKREGEQPKPDADSAKAGADPGEDEEFRSAQAAHRREQLRQEVEAELGDDPFAAAFLATGAEHRHIARKNEAIG